MTVEEYFEEWWTPKEVPENGFNKTAMLDFAEMYHNQALRIHDVVGRRKQLICDNCKSGLINYPEIGRRTCSCGRLGYNVTD